jgi:hypothetical protein
MRHQAPRVLNFLCSSGRYPDLMADTDKVPTETERMLAAADIQVTDEGRERVKAQLAELDAYWTPERRERVNREFLARIASE